MKEYTEIENRTVTKLIGPATMKDYTFDEWKNLSKKEKALVINQYWDPFNAKIGFETKSRYNK